MAQKSELQNQQNLHMNDLKSCYYCICTVKNTLTNYFTVRLRLGDHLYQSNRKRRTLPLPVTPHSTANAFTNCQWTLVNLFTRAFPLETRSPSQFLRKSPAGDEVGWLPGETGKLRINSKRNKSQSEDHISP